MSDGNGSGEVVPMAGAGGSVFADRVAEAKRRLAEAVPGALDSIIDLSVDAKTEPIKLQAAKAVLDTAESYRKEEAEAKASEMSDFIDQQIVYLLKELGRKNVFIQMLDRLGEGATPEEIIELRVQTDSVFGVGDVIEGELDAGDSDSDSDSD